ncbi:MAG: VWA domain-containing protein [Myxococcales bacterium]|nr:VWA domain-containing protein [Myxococcales bacterium]
MPDSSVDAVSFVRALRGAGLCVGIEQSIAFARALSWLAPLDRRSAYLAGRSTLVVRRVDLATYDAVFDAFWLGQPRRQPTPQAPRHDPDKFRRTALMAYMATRPERDAKEVEVSEHQRAASPLEQLQRKDFGELTPEEHVALQDAMRRLRFQPARRRTRRRIFARRGDQTDLRRALREFAQRGVVPRLPRRRRKWKQRPVVVLADVSGSMELYSRLLLQFLHGLSHQLTRMETFVFGTRLTRITPALKLRNVDSALEEATSSIPDFGGGTRIAECLASFHREHALRVLRGGAVVLVVSDGWETGDAEDLGVQVARIRERCHRLVWLNPLMGRAGYHPAVQGMASALQHVDDFLPIHDLRSLVQLANHLSRLPSRRGSSRAHAPGRYR